jgi:hypothetical protein
MPGSGRDERSGPWVGTTATLLLVVATLTSTSSAAAGGATTSQSVAARLDRALHAWAGFPARSSPRPVVLLQGDLLNPVHGFPDDSSKEAFDNGQITPPASWPGSPTRSMGFPVIGASAAFTILTTPTSHPVGSSPPLVTTSVQLGSGLFLTDRGWRALPAWLFSFTGVENPAKVVAVGPSAIYPAPATSAATAPAPLSVTTAPGSRHIVANFAGAPAGTGTCTASYTLSIKESPEAVAIAVRSHPHPAPPGVGDVACALVAVLRHASAELNAPIGPRVVVDAASEAASVTAPHSGGISGG